MIRLVHLLLSTVLAAGLATTAGSVPQAAAARPPEADITSARQVGMWYSTWYTAKRRFLWLRGHGIGSNRQLVGDVNGDGRADAVVYFGNTGSWYVALSNGNGFNQYSLWRDGHGIGSTNQLLGDVNADGRADAVAYFGNALAGNWYVALSNGNGFNQYSLWRDGHGVGSTRQLLNDVDGDRRADAVAYFGNTGSWYVALSNGNGFNQYSLWRDGHGIGSTNQLLGDVNADGRADAVAYFGNALAGNWYVAASSGAGFHPYFHWKNTNLPNPYRHPGTNWTGLADADGDRTADPVTYAAVDGSWRVLPAGFTYPTPMNLWDAWDIRYRPIVGGVARQYDSSDPVAVDEQLRMIAAAGVDFLIFDLTNHVQLNDPPHPPILSNALAVCREIARLNAQEGLGLRYAIAIGAVRFYRPSDPAIVENEAAFVNQNFVNNASCGGPANYYQLAGRPLLLSMMGYTEDRLPWEQYPDHSQTAAFTVRFVDGQVPAGNNYPSRTPNGGCGTPPSSVPPASDYGLYFGWGMPWGALPVSSGAMTVMPGWNNHEYGGFVSRTQYGSPGGFYTTCGWDRVLTASPRPTMVIVPSFNEFAEENAVQPADTTLVTGSTERWPYPDYYWRITTQKIAAYKLG